MEKILLEADKFSSILDKMADDILSWFDDLDQVVMIGIRTRGVALSERLLEIIKEKTGKELPLGVLDITLYRDDLAMRDKRPVVKGTKIPFDINDKFVVLVDDVLFTGRTVRAALNEIIDFGRPAAVRLAVLVDRGLRELPVQADLVGMQVATLPPDKVRVRLSEIDSEDEIRLIKTEET